MRIVSAVLSSDDPVGRVTAEIEADDSLDSSVRREALAIPLEEMRKVAHLAALRAATSELNEGDSDQARRLLNSCGEEYRDAWEWKHLDARIDLAQAT